MKRPAIVTVVLGVLALAALLGVLVGLRPSSPLLDEPAPEFTLAVAFGEGSERGDRVRLSDLRGRVVVLDFWASWCGPCKASVPDLNQVANTYRDRGVSLFGINSESVDAGPLSRLALSWGFAYPILRDPAVEAQLAYGVEAFPSLFVVDRTGIVRFVHFGAPSAARLAGEIESLLH